MCGYKTARGDMAGTRGKEGPRLKVEEEEHLKVNGGLRGGTGIKSYLHGPLHYAKRLESAIWGARLGPNRTKGEHQ